MKSTKWLVMPLIGAALAASSAMSTVASAAPGVQVQVSLNHSAKLHPLLQYGADVEPAKPVRVIVQLSKSDVHPSDIALQVPGLHVDESFGLVPAFVAEVPQGALAALANLPTVRYVSPDGAVQVLPGSQPGKDHKDHAERPKAPEAKHESKDGPRTNNLVTTYPFDTRATDAWAGIGDDGHSDTGANIAVAVIDSGIDATHPDISGQVLAINVNRNSQTPGDGYGHGTHVAGIINSHEAAGRYLGIAPSTTLISVKVADDNGAAYESDLLRGLDWVYLNRDAYRIQALNLSVSVSVPESYATSPVDAAVEFLWFRGVTVIASAGNLGATQDAVWYAPANDPYIITVGCLDDTMPGSPSLCPISSRGVTEDGFAKPDLVAPGRKILSALSDGVGAHGSALAAEFPERVTSDGHIRLSGTSMAAPMVTGAVALLLDRKHDLSPSQIKQILTSTAMAYTGQPDHAGALNIANALIAVEHPPAKDGIVPVPVGGVVPPHDATTLVWDGARWGSAYWNGARWGSAYWNGARWGAAEWDGARWGSAYWNGARWGSAYWDGARWGSSEWDGARWGSADWD